MSYEIKFVDHPDLVKKIQEKFPRFKVAPAVRFFLDPITEETVSFASYGSVIGHSSMIQIDVKSLRTSAMIPVKESESFDIEKGFTESIVMEIINEIFDNYRDVDVYCYSVADSGIVKIDESFFAVTRTRIEVLKK